MVESLASFAAAVAKYPREVATCQYKWYNGPKTAFLTDQMALAEEEVVCPSYIMALDAGDHQQPVHSV